MRRHQQSRQLKQKVGLWLKVHRMLASCLFSYSATKSSTTSTVTDIVSIMTPKDLEESCRIPAAVTTGALAAILLPLHTAAMFAFLSKITQGFNPNHIQAAGRHQMRMKNML